MYGYFCIGFIDLMLKGKSLTDVTNLFLPNDSKKNDDIVLNFLKLAEYNSIKCNSIESADIYPNLNNQLI